METKENSQIAIDDMRNKLKLMEQDNQNINEQLFSLQNKFYVQTKILNDKNSELSKEVSLNQKIKSENSKILKESNEIKKKINEITNQNTELKSEIEKVRKELRETSQKYNEANLKSNFLIGQLEEQNQFLSNENLSLKESSSKLKTQLDFLYNDMKAKESKLIFSLKNENKETEKNLRNEIINLKKQNETLIIESQQLKQHKISLANELSTTINESRNPSNISLSIGNQNLVISQLEQRVKELNDENKNFQEQIKQMEDNALLHDKKLKAIKLDLQQSEKDSKQYFNIIKEKENELSQLEAQNLKLKSEIEKGKSVDNLMLELQEKNQTITFLLSQMDDIKNQLAKEEKTHKEKINEMKNEKENLIEKLQLAQSQFKQASEGYQSKLNDIKSENEILVNELNDKDKEYTELLKDKMDMETRYDNQFKQAEKNVERIQEMVNSVNQENEELKNELAQCQKALSEKMEELNAKTTKSKNKMESLMAVYDNHITFLKDRFNHILNDLMTITNIKSNPKELNEKFANLTKTIQSSLNEINHLSEREALIDNFKGELKNLKNQLSIAEKKIKKLEAENFDLNQVLNVKKLQMKINPKTGQVTQQEKFHYDLTQLIKNYASITELNTQMLNMQTKLENQKAEIKLLKEQLQASQEDSNKTNSNINQLNIQINNKTKEISDMSKNHKNEMKALLDEVKKIRETWMPPEKKAEYLAQVDELEKVLKTLKDDINRKKDIITTLKNQLNSSKNDIPLNLNQEKDNTQLNTKIKNLTKEISRKDNLIREAKTNCEQYKLNEKKLEEEKESLIEKNKLQKTDIQRKEAIIKELKDKIVTLNINLEKEIKSNETTMISHLSRSSSIVKLKQDNERKEGLIKTLKAKNGALSIELDQMKAMQFEKSRTNSIDLEREQKKHSITRDKLDNYLLLVEKMSSCIRIILKDLVNAYEREKNKAIAMNIPDTMKEGMSILGVNENEVDDFLNPNNNPKEDINSKVNQLLRLDGKFFDCDKALNLYNSLKNKISQYQFNNQNNLSTNSLSRKGNTNNQSNSNQDRGFLPDFYFNEEAQ